MARPRAALALLLAAAAAQPVAAFAQFAPCEIALVVIAITAAVGGLIALGPLILG